MGLASVVPLIGDSHSTLKARSPPCRDATAPVLPTCYPWPPRSTSTATRSSTTDLASSPPLGRFAVSMAFTSTRQPAPVKRHSLSKKARIPKRACLERHALAFAIFAVTPLLSTRCRVFRIFTNPNSSTRQPCFRGFVQTTLECPSKCVPSGSHRPIPSFQSSPNPSKARHPFTITQRAESASAGLLLKNCRGCFVACPGSRSGG